jgi:hypothetical protein
MPETDFKKLTVNPFDDDVVKEPRDIPTSVLGLNDAPLKIVLQTFTNLEKGRKQGDQVSGAKAQLIISPERGYGKSHLLGRLFETLDRRATRIYLRPFQDPQKCWHSILLQTVQELERTEGPGLESETNPTQVGAFASGVISGLTVLRIDDKSEPWFKWIRRVFKSKNDLRNLAAKLRGHIPNLNGRHEAWLRVLYAYAFSSENDWKRTVTLKWIRGEPLERDEVDELGLAAADNEAKADMTPDETNELSFQRLAGLCRLAGFYRPFVFCFDQTESYGTNSERIRTLGGCIERMFAELPNQLTVVTANQDNWTRELQPGIEPPHRDRISAPIQLESITITQAKELIRNRLISVGLDFRQAEEFYGTTWLTDLFKPGRMSVRDLLHRASERLCRLQGLAAPPAKDLKLRIEELFKTQVNTVKTQSALRRYSQDALMWFTQDLANGVKGIQFEKESSNKWFSTKWIFNDRLIYFAFEGGDNAARWKVIANEAINLADKRGAKKLIVFRTPDLAKIPKATWKAIGPTVEAARKAGLNIHFLELNSVCEIHAARDLYADAREGNIDEKPEDILAWLKSHFEQRIVELCAEASATELKPPETKGAEPKPKKTETLSSKKKTEVLQFIEHKRFVSAHQVIKELRLSVSVEILLKEIQGAPIKTFPGPETVIIQWRNLSSR